MDEEKIICHRCIGEGYVKKFIKENGLNRLRCSYCNSKSNSVSLEILTDLVHKMLENHYECSNFNDHYEGFTGDSAQHFISQELDIAEKFDEEVVDDIYTVLCEKYNPYSDYEPGFYNEDFVYRKRNYSSRDLDYSWQDVKRSLQKEARFFNRKVENFLDSLFSDIEQLQTNDNKSPITIINKGELLYRARVFEDYAEVEEALRNPEKNFGPPPSSLARSGCMNSQGISVFYGATSEKIALAEVRPPVGSYVVIAPFELMRDLRIFDITALNSIILSPRSVFDPQSHLELERTAFLNTFSRKLTLPVFGKNTDNEYLATQAISEYLSVSKRNNLDGLSFKSTQVKVGSKVKGSNVVLFNKCSKVKNANNKKIRYKVELFEEIGDGDDMFRPSISLIEDVNKKKRSLFSSSSSSTNFDLELKENMLTFHSILGVEYNSSATLIAKESNYILRSTDINDG